MAMVAAVLLSIAASIPSPTTAALGLLHAPRSFSSSTNVQALPAGRKYTTKCHASRAEELESPSPSPLMPSTMIWGSEGEVVGATGKIGSFLLACGKGRLAAVPRRGVAAGCLSRPGTPLYLCVPTTERDAVDICPGREGDVVFVGNGIPLSAQKNQTHVVPHFGVSNVGRLSDAKAPRLPTFVYGPQAHKLQELLSMLPVETVASWNCIRQVAIRKILWASTMLLCHAANPPKDIGTVHAQEENVLKVLVQELLPVARKLVVDDDDDDDHGDDDDDHDEKKAADQEDVSFLLSLEHVMKYLKSYSDSLPSTTIPSLSLALKEWKERNGLFFPSPFAVSQSLYAQLLRNVVLGREPQTPQIKKIRTDMERAMSDNENENINDKTPPQEESNRPKILHSTTCGTMTFVTTQPRQPQTPPQREVVIVGGGILGTFLAYSIARRFSLQDNALPKITVYDAGAPNDKIGETSATEGSWGWLNSNDKHPFSYHLFNCLGLSLWKRSPDLQHFGVEWTGSLVKRSPLSSPEKHDRQRRHDGSYGMEGPLSPSRLATLEPLLAAPNHHHDGNNQEDFFFFPDEGHVSPSRLRQEVRRRAQEEWGVHFVDGVQVTEICNEPLGICFRHASQQDPQKNNDSFHHHHHHASLVIVTAGMDCSRLVAAGGQLPLQPQSLGYLAHCPSLGHGQLQRIIVDTVTKCHFLYRPNEGIVIGGGHLQSGGEENGKDEKEEEEEEEDDDDDDDDDDEEEETPEATLLESQKKQRGMDLWRAAQHVAPKAFVDAHPPPRVTAARRPIPLDGFPAVGFSSPGVYVAVTHSGVTLGPLLGELVAMEIVEGVQCDVLQPYRPERFLTATTLQDDLAQNQNGNG